MKQQPSFLSKTFMVSLLVLFSGSIAVNAQDSPPESKGPTAEELAKANNPLADMKAFNIQNYYRPSLYELDDATSNTAWLRFAVPTGRVLWRLSAPFQTVSVNGNTTSGFGDMDLFGAYLAVNKPTFTFGVGPSLVMPTATDENIGTGKWSGGLAVVAFAAPSPTFQVGGLVTWSASFAGQSDREDTNNLIMQPFGFWQLGGGTYLRTAPLWVFNLRTGEYHVPMGFGIGQVLKSGNTVFNIFIEPQFTVLHYGTGQPAFQLYTALNMQFKGKK